jgi:hypothetical protein
VFASALMLTARDKIGLGVAAAFRDASRSVCYRLAGLIEPCRKLYLCAEASPSRAKVSEDAMTNPEQGNTSTDSAGLAPSARSPHLIIWIRELPFGLMLLLMVGGVAYTSFSKHPILIYWEMLAPLIGLVCVWYGWAGAADRSARLRLIGTQALHWLAFVLVMNMIYFADVQRFFNATSSGLAIFTLLALGTFTAGAHILSWQVCLLGLIMAFAIPAIAWIENSALLLVLVAAIVVGVGAAIWWHWREGRLPRS